MFGTFTKKFNWIDRPKNDLWKIGTRYRNPPKNSNVILIKNPLPKKACYDIFIFVERLGAPLTQAFGILMGKFYIKPHISPKAIELKIK